MILAYPTAMVWVSHSKKCKETTTIISLLIFEFLYFFSDTQSNFLQDRIFLCHFVDDCVLGPITKTLCEQSYSYKITMNMQPILLPQVAISWCRFNACNSKLVEWSTRHNNPIQDIAHRLFHSNPPFNFSNCKKKRE